jgi:hypothetical protein
MSNVHGTMDWLQLVRSEYLEMPGLLLTGAQAGRLWGLENLSCTTVLDRLVKEGFLRITPDGQYTRKMD